MLIWFAGSSKNAHSSLLVETWTTFKRMKRIILSTGLMRPGGVRLTSSAWAVRWIILVLFRGGWANFGGFNIIGWLSIAIRWVSSTFISILLITTSN